MGVKHMRAARSSGRIISRLHAPPNAPLAPSGPDAHCAPPTHASRSARTVTPRRDPADAISTLHPEEEDPPPERSTPSQPYALTALMTVLRLYAHSSTAMIRARASRLYPSVRTAPPPGTCIPPWWVCAVRNPWERSPQPQQREREGVPRPLRCNPARCAPPVRRAPLCAARPTARPAAASRKRQPPNCLRSWASEARTLAAF